MAWTSGAYTEHQYAELRRSQVASAGDALAGLWLIAAPFILDFTDSGAATTNHVFIGALVAIMGLVRAINPDRREGISWTNVVLGFWMILAPGLLGYADIDRAQVNSIVVGVVILALAAFAGWETNRAHHETADVR